MNKYITALILATVAGTAMAQLKFQPKHPGITVRQIQQSQQEVSPVLPLVQSKNQPAMAPAVEDEGELRLDSIYVSYGDDLQRVRYYEYHPNGNMALQLSKQLDYNGNWIEMDHIVWTENYPLKGSSMIEYGYDTQGIYCGIYKKTYNDDDTDSYTEYYGANDQWTPSFRVSTTLNEHYMVQSEAYYKYDAQGNEVAEDSVTYTYNADNRLVCETYFFADDNGQLVEAGSFITTYDNVQTPSGPGELVTTMMSDEGYKRETITSEDQNYQFYAVYTKEGSSEWNKRQERCEQICGDTLMVISLKYQDNTLRSGQKVFAINKENSDDRRIDFAWEYSCTTDSSQWQLLRRIEDYNDIYPSPFGREDAIRQTYIYKVDENGEIHNVYDVLTKEDTNWTDAYTKKVYEYYEEELVYIDSEGKEVHDFIETNGVNKTYFYHDPHSTAITDIQAQPQIAPTYTLFGTKATDGYRGIMIRDGKKVMWSGNK